VELVLAMTLLSMGSIAVFGSLLFSRRLSEGSIHQNAAVTVVQGYIEQMKNMEFADLPCITSSGAVLASCRAFFGVAAVRVGSSPRTNDMSIKLRFALLLGMLLLVFLGCLATLRLLEKQQLTEALATSQRDATGMLERWLDLNGSSLRQFTEDYSRWDELVSFVKTRDPEWAELNLRASLANFNIYEAWVLTPEGALIYQTRQEQVAPPPLAQ
jgi:hypothetical protein